MVDALNLTLTPTHLFMQFRRSVLGGLWLCLALIGVLSLHGQDIPAGGAPLLTQATPQESGFYSNTTPDGPVATREFVNVTGQDFTTATRVATLNPTGSFWSSVMTFTSNRDVADGDVVLLHFWMRSIETTDESGTVTMEAFVEGPAPDYTKSISMQVRANSSWQHFYLPFSVDGSYPTGNLGFKFGFGATGRAQVLEFGGVEALWYGTSLTVDDLPRTSFQYDGRDENASWRFGAASRINQYRKNRYVVRALDSAGMPVAGEQLRVRLDRHAFEFGTAMVASRIMDQVGTANATYREKILELFNSGTMENDTKWPPWDGEWGAGFNRDQTIGALQWTQANELTMRGHVLVWPSIRNLPNWLTPLVQSADPSVPDRVITHIDDVMSATAGYFVDWDVMNEPYDNFDLMVTYGYDLMAEWFKEAHNQQPTVGRYINDYGILSGGGLNTTKQDAYEATIQRILDDGGPLTGIGFQGHFSGSPTGIPKVWEVMNRYSNAFPDMDMRITEFDITGEDSELQADYLRDFYTIAFSHPKMVGVQAWGFWAEAHWREESAFYDSDWNERPIGTAYRELVHGEWLTNDLRPTGIDGRIEGRGFHGDYVVEDAEGNQVGTFSIGPDSPAVVDVTLNVSQNPAAAFVVHPLGATVEPGDSWTLTAETTGIASPVVTWYREGVGQVGTGTILSLTNINAGDAGKYYARAEANGSMMESRWATVGVRSSGANRVEKLANISTRARVEQGAGALVAGFVINGTSTKDLVIRAVGPRLGEFGVPGTLADPQIKLYRGSTVIAQNDAWDPSLATDFAALGAFDMGNDTDSAALRASLSPGAYTVEVSGADGGTGVALAEVYDASTGAPLEMVNIASRGFVHTGADIMVAGFVIQGDVPQKVLVRGVGPMLETFGVPGTLSDPVLRLYQSVPGGTPRHLRTNFDWTAASNADELVAAAAEVGAFALRAGLGDAAILIELEPGPYTVELAGNNGGTGIGLIEVYKVP